jgi:hypothetical protein
MLNKKIMYFHTCKQVQKTLYLGTKTEELGSAGEQPNKHVA